MVLRVLRNPDGLRSETVGPFSTTYDTSVAAGLLAITADDLSGVTPTQVDPAGITGWAPAATIRATAGMAPPVHRPFYGYGDTHATW